MKTARESYKMWAILICAALFAGCTVMPAGTYYRAVEVPVNAGYRASFPLGPNDQTYTLQIFDRTPLGLFQLPQTVGMLYNKGYDEVRRRREASFSVDVTFSFGVVDNPALRAGNTLGGALFGAATGAILGGAFGDPGRGAAIGAASGGFLGLAAPAPSSLVRIDINLYHLYEHLSAHRTTTVDISGVPPYDVAHVIDSEVARALEDLPRR